MSSFDPPPAHPGSAVPLSQRAMAPPTAPAYLDQLNPAQREAVEALDGPVLMLAGAGTGKTKALTTRIAHLLRTGRARPNEILAVTFTNKAAREMKNRVGHLLGQPAEGMPWLGTFHAICVKLLRRHAELAGLKSNFSILDTDDQVRLMKQLIQAANIDEKRWPPRQLAGIIDNWKNRAWTPENVPAAEATAFNNRGTELYAAYQARLKTLNAVDFGDLLLHMVTIFRDHEDVLAQYQRWFKYILVDEYQDTNVAQYLWLRLLAQDHKNICCVGDDDQSIYGWRGAEVGNILRFEKDFPGAKVVRLEQNYRSTPHILAAAAGVIRGNEDRLGKELWTEAEDGEKVRLIGHWDGEEEARWIGDEIEALYTGSSSLAKRRENTRMEMAIEAVKRLSDSGALLGLNSREELVSRLSKHDGFLSETQNKALLWELTTRLEEGLSIEPAILRFYYEEIAILVRASHQMRAFEDRFLTIGLPYRVIGGPRFYERLEIRDAMAYFRLAVSPDDALAFERIVNTPRRGLGDKAVQTIQRMARDYDLPLVDAAARCVQEGAIKGKGAKGLSDLVQGIYRWHAATLGPVREISEDPPAAQEANADVFEDDFPPFKDIGYGQPDAPATTVVRGEPELSHIELAEMILEESGYTGMWQNDKTPEAPGRLENLKELVKALEQFENLQGFLEHVALIMDNEESETEEKVTIMTLHAAKGLEYPVVFLPGWEDGLFPSQRSMDESGLKGLEEERRLAYVGITRAEELCTISFAANRRVYGQWQSQLPSRFVDELPEEHVDVLTQTGLYGGGYGAADDQFGASPLEDRAARANAYNSPGWRRMQSRGATRSMATPNEARGLTIDSTALSAFSQGDRVFHQKFGYGYVMGIEGDKLDVEFEHAGAKKVVAKFIKPADRAGEDDVPF